MLYCEKCGKEIQMVPDFDPELESNISGSLNEFLDEIVPKDAGDDREEPEEKSGEKFGKKAIERINLAKKRRRVLALSIPIILVFLLGVLSGIWVHNYRMASPDYQVELANAAVSKNNYTLAIEKLRAAYELDPTQVSLLFDMADYYYLTGNVDDCIITLNEIAFADEASTEQIVEAYRKIISIYEGTGDYEKISRIMADCRDASALALFRDYGAAAPEFSHAEGTYNEVIPLKLIASGSGNVYYTLDGQEPGQESNLYTIPIFLEPGETTVRAVYVNPYGVASEIVSHTYNVDVPSPDAPLVNLPSGEFTSPQVIRVEVPEGVAIYYTTDYTEPNKDSIAYTGPIAMPIGSTTYKFIAYNEEGIASEVTTCNYVLKIENALPVTECVNQLLTALLSYGKIADLQGHAEGVAGRYLYQLASVVHIDTHQSDFYIFTEFYEDATGIQTKTGAVYAANVYSGQLFSCTQRNAVTFDIQSDLYYQFDLEAQLAAQEAEAPATPQEPEPVE